MSEQLEIQHLAEEIFANAHSIKEDVEYGTKVKKKILLSDDERKELYHISDQLMKFSEKIGMQFIIQDFE